MSVQLKSTLYAGLISAVLAGCSSDNGSNTQELEQNQELEQEQGPEILLGQLTELNISGIDYQTETQSGTLTESGFNYIDGETVSFSVDGAEVYSGDAKQLVSLAHLVKGYPYLQGGLESALRNQELNTELHKTVNTLYLLASLDSDNNAENGISVSLVGNEDIFSQVDLDLSIRKFVEQLDEVLTANNPMYSPTLSAGELIAATYQAAGVDMQVQLRVKETEDWNADGTVDSMISWQYDDQNRLISRTVDDDLTDNCVDDDFTAVFHVDGSITESDNSREYYDDERGCIVRRFFSSTHNANGQETAYQSKYDNYPYNGVFDNHYSSTTAYSEAGHPISRIRYQDGGVNGAVEVDGNFDSVWYFQITTNDQGFITQEIGQHDLGIDESIDEASTYTSTYNEAGQLLTYQYVQDADNNESTPNHISTSTYTYDEFGKDLTNTYLSDSDGDGTPESGNTYIYTYNDDGRLIAKDFTYTYNNNLSHVNGNTYEYDEAGNRSALSYYYDADFTDEVYDRTRDATYEYDDQGRETKEIEYEFRNGVHTDTESYTYTYDEFGNDAVELYEEDSDVDGFYEYFEREEYQYNQDQNELSETYYEGSVSYEGDVAVYTVEYISKYETIYNEFGNPIKSIDSYDEVLEGEFIEDSITEYEYINIENGVEYLVNDYID